MFPVAVSRKGNLKTVLCLSLVQSWNVHNVCSTLSPEYFSCRFYLINCLIDDWNLVFVLEWTTIFLKITVEIFCLNVCV